MIEVRSQALSYKGYHVAVEARPVFNGLFAASLTLDPTDAPGQAPVHFDAVDYFFEPDHALAYGARWGRMWIDARA
jgi:hypothetical protein